MTVPSPRVPFRFESVARMATGRDLTSLIVPVKEGLAKLDQLSADMASLMMGAFLILRGESGSGKSTLLQTAGLFRDGIETVNVTRDEPIADALRALVPRPGAMRIVVVADREASGDTTEVEIEAAILATNAFIRSRAGERTVVVWPCNSDPIAEKLVEVAAQIGADALLGVEEPVFRYSGPHKADYLPIARKTIETFNLGASLANLGISDERAEQLADDAATIGQFLKRLQIEERNNRQTLAVRLEARESFRLWILVIAKNDMEADVAALTRGRGSTVDIDRLMVSTDANIVQSVKEHPERIGLLGTSFEAKLVQLPALTAIDVVREYADDALNALLDQQGFRVPGPTNGRGRLLDSELAGAFRGEPVGTARRGPKAGLERLAPYDALIAVSRTNDIALNRALGRALIDCELIERFDQEVILGASFKVKSDLICDPHLDPVRLEVMWRAEVSRSQVANYLLSKLDNYGRAIGFV